MPRQPNSSNNLLVTRPRLASFYSPKNIVPVDQVFKADTREFLFICEFCSKEFISSPSRKKGKFQLAYCPECHEIESQHQSFLKMQDNVASKGSLADLYPGIAASWIKASGYSFQYSPSTVTSQATINVLWQCPDVKYHQWTMRVDNRVNFPRCPYCRKQRIHILESYYTILKNKGLLQYLHEDDIEKAKNYSTGSTKGKLRHYCKTCHKPYSTIPKNFLNLDGCSNCYKSTASETRRKRLVENKGSIADNDQLYKQYCYDQTFIEEEKRNLLHPKDVPLSFTKAVWWICPKGHYTRASPANRNRGHICSKCSNNTSLLEIILYTELAALPDIKNTEFRFIYNIRGNEIDIALQDLKYAIEVDGYAYHKNRIKSDIQKQLDVIAKGYRFIRVRDSRLSPLNSSINISFDRKHVEQKSIFADEDSDKRSQSHDHICNILNHICSIVGIKCKFYQLKHIDKAKKIWLETRQIKVDDSVAYLYPELLKDFDITMNPPNLLENVTYGSTVPVHWKCHKCGHKWTTAVMKRTIEGTGCPVDSGQVVSKVNAVGTLFPEIIDAFVNPEEAFQYTAGSGQRALFRCTYPGCTAEPQKRAIKDVIKRIQRSCTTEFYTCKHQ
ncbi:TPA: zinc-ribbon domain-containing protein [Vibrio cholerae]